MIGTVHTQSAQLSHGYYQSGTGPLKILLLGSCRILAYLNYLDLWNKRSGNTLTVYHIDPCHYHWNESGQLVDFEAQVTACEQNPRILAALKESDIFIHEWFSYYGMFNTSKDSPKNIYQFGLNPRLDICLPNFHDRFVLFHDLLTFDEGFKKRALKGMTHDLSKDIVARGLAALDKFYDICRLSSFPEFADHFKETWTRTRFFWTGNHVSAEFTLYLYRQLNDRFLHLPFDDAHWNEIRPLDIFSTPCTPVTKHDIKEYGLTWA